MDFIYPSKPCGELTDCDYCHLESHGIQLSQTGMLLCVLSEESDYEHLKLGLLWKPL